MNAQILSADGAANYRWKYLKWHSVPRFEIDYFGSSMWADVFSFVESKIIWNFDYFSYFVDNYGISQTTQ